MKIKSVFGNLLANKKKVAKKKSDAQKYFKLGQKNSFEIMKKKAGIVERCMEKLLYMIKRVYMGL